MPKLLELDRTFQIAMPANANGGWVDLKWDSSWRVAALLAGGADRGKIEIVSGFGRFAALDSAAGAGFKPLLVAGPVLADVLPGAGLPYLTITVTPTYGVGVRDPGLTLVYRGRPHETSTGIWNLTDIGSDGSGPVLVTQTQRQNIDDALGSLTGKLSRADDDHAAVTVSLADSAQLRDLVAQLAGSLLLPTYSAFPVASGYSGRYAVALDTGAMYQSNGSIWGSSIGYVTTKAANDALAARLSAVETGQASATLGYLTLAAMNADLARPAGALARVTNDPTPANNADYIKLGASGAGSWQAASTSRLAVAEGNITTNAAQISAALENRARTARTAQMISQALGIRTGTPTLPIYSNGAFAFSWVDNDGTWPLSAASWPKIMRATATSTSVVDFGPRTLGATVWATGRKVVWGAWFNRTAAAALSTDRLWGQAIWLNAAGGVLSATNGGGIPLASWAVIGATATLNGLTATITATRGGLSYVQYTATTPAGAYGMAYEFRLAGVIAGSSSVLDVLFNGLLLDTDTIDPYTAYGDTLADADPAGGVRAVQASQAALGAVVGGKQDKPLPLKPPTYTNAVRSRYSAIGGSALSARLLVEPGLSATFLYDPASTGSRGEPNIIWISGTVGSGTYKAASFFLSPADLALLGIVPNDTTPPTISVRAGILKASAFNLDPAKFASVGSAGSVQVWTALRYGGSASQAGFDTAKDRTWANVGAASIYNTPGATTGAATRTDDGTRILFQRLGVPVLATLGGLPLTGAMIEFIINGNGGAIGFGIDQMAVTPGSTQALTGDFYNLPEDILSAPSTGGAVSAPPSTARIVSSGGVYYVASPNSATELTVTRWQRMGLNNVFQPSGCAFIPASTLDADIPATANAGMIVCGDDAAPLRINGTMAGGNHGHNTMRLLTTSTAHALTIQDIGSRWSDGVKTYTLVEIPSSTTLRIAQDATTVVGGGWVLSATAPITGTILTHSSGAVHTAALTISADVLAADLIAVRPVSYTYQAGAVPVASTGVYSALELVATEEYDVIDYPALMVALQARAGSGAAVDYIAAGLAAVMNVRLVYRIRGSEATIDTILTAGSRAVTHQGTGIVQAQALAWGSGTLVATVQDTLPITATSGTYALARGANITPLSDYLLIDPAYWAVSGTPPSRWRETVVDAGGVALYSLEIGYSETHGHGRPAARAALLGIGNAGYIASFRKLYPALTNSPQAVGGRLMAQAFRRYTRG